MSELERAKTLNKIPFFFISAINHILQIWMCPFILQLRPFLTPSLFKITTLAFESTYQYGVGKKVPTRVEYLRKEFARILHHVELPTLRRVFMQILESIKHE